MNRISLAAALALGLAAIPAMAQDAAAGSPADEAQEARIPLANEGGIRDWRFGDEDTLYIQDRFGKWYEAKLMSPVVGLRTELTIGFDTGGGGSFDKFSSVIVRGQRYPINSLVELAGEPPKEREAAKADGKADNGLAPAD